jgi:cytoskeletal protein CcmA (bactofilin family)
MNSSLPKSETIRAELEAFRATLPGLDVKFPSGSFATELQMAAWHTREKELQRALSEAEMSERAKSESTPFRPGANVVSKEVRIEGTIKFTHELIIDGSVEGEILGDGLLKVGENADIRGEIKTTSATVSGRVTGHITVGERCELKAGAHFLGDLRAGRLVMEEGATFIGTSEVPLNKDKAPAAKTGAPSEGVSAEEAAKAKRAGRER